MVFISFSSVSLLPPSAASAPEKKRHRFFGRVPRGVVSRNTGLDWVRRNANDGVVYFADDDNTYDIRLFSEVSATSDSSARLE